MLNTNSSATSQAYEQYADKVEREGAKFKLALAIAGYTGDDLPPKPKYTTPALEAAMGYAVAPERGWKVFPADVETPKTKKSYLAEKYAGTPWGMTSDTNLLRVNFTNNRWRLKCGVAVPTGKVNGIFVVEADTKEGHDVDGLAALKDLELDHGMLPNTLTAESPSGSLHYYFNHPGRGFKVKNSASEIAPGVDVRGDGGMVVAPPTKRADGEYRWLNNLPIADAPQWLIDLVTEEAAAPAPAPSGNAFEQYADKVTGGREQAYAKKALSNVAAELSEALEGERNHKLNRCAYRMGRMIARDWIARAEVEVELEAAAEACGLDEGVSATIASGIKGGLKKPHEDLKEKPQLPGKMKPWIVELGEKIWGPASVHDKEYRFGPDQTKVIDPGKGMWFDFATNKGGGLRDLMKMVERANRSTSAEEIQVVCAADVVMRPLDYLWPGHLMRGAQELLSGLPDVGKSQVQIGFIACATARLRWPDGAPAIEPVNVIMLTAEDTLDQAVVPRLRAAGADVSRVQIVRCIKTDDLNPDRQFLLGEDLERLERLVNKIGNVGLVCIDPITAYMGGKIDSHKVTEVRSQLGPLKDFAERMNIAVSTITHPAKSAGAKALDQFIGSQAFIAACRIGHLCIEEVEIEDDGERHPTGRHLLTNVRNSNEEKRLSLAYRKEAVMLGYGITAPRVVWDGEVNITADAAVTASLGKKPDAQKKVQAFLREVLKSGEPMRQKEVEALAAQKGFTEKQVRLAKERLNITSTKEGGTMDGPWLWTLI